MNKRDSLFLLDRYQEAEDRIAALESALRKIESNDMRYDLTACAQIARAALEPAAPTLTDAHYTGDITDSIDGPEPP